MIIGARAPSSMGSTQPRPHDRAEGYAISGGDREPLNREIVRLEIAATSEAGQKHINVEGPMAGRILPETMIPDGVTASMAGNELRVGEPDLPFAWRRICRRGRRPTRCKRF